MNINKHLLVFILILLFFCVLLSNSFFRFELPIGKLNVKLNPTYNLIIID